MAGVFRMENREVIRVTVKKCDGLIQPEYKRFCIDPQITSFEVLQSLLSRAFNTKSSFTISYLAKDSYGRETYLSMLSDWDLDAAFISASDPCLRLKVDFRPFDEGLEDWDIIANKEVPQHRISQLIDRNSLLGSITGTISTHVGKTVSQVSKAMGLKNEEEALAKPIKPPMSDAEFHNFLDGVGVLVRPQEFRLCVYQGGIDQSLRRVVWRHLLNIYPEGMTGRERFDYLKRKSTEYYKLRDEWRIQFSQGKGSEEVKYVTNMVKKDVLRTDRTHSFYAGDDDNSNVLSLFNILVTYALTHPTVSYCQGMSDIASPILVIQKDEAHAYACFCGLMRRLKSNFLLEGEVMNTKFQHLSLLLQHHDMEFFSYLKYHNAEDLFFCYRWLLLELKREFPFDEALLMLETMWSSLPPNPPYKELPLTDPDFKLDSLRHSSPSSPAMSLAQGSNAYMRLMSLRRHTPSPLSNTSATSKFDSVNNKALCGGSQGNHPVQNGSCHSNGENKAEITNNTITADSHISPAGTSTPVDEDPKHYPSLQDMIPRSLLDKCNSIEKSLQHISLHAGLTSGGEKGNCNSNGDASISPEKSGESSDSGSTNQISDGTSINCSSSSDAEVKSVPSVSINDNTDSEKTAPVNEAGLSRLEINDINTENGHLDKLGSAVSPPTSPKRPTDIPLKEVNSQKIRTGIPYANDPKPALVRNSQGMVTERVMQTSNISSCEEVTEPLSIEFVKVNEKLPRLPAPHEFGSGNPFLIFLCLTLLLQHRDHIVRNRMDYNELAMHFDKMVRKHNVQKVLQQAKSLYAIYLRNQAVQDNEEDSDDRPSV